jgi:hypothetical protein
MSYFITTRTATGSQQTYTGTGSPDAALAALPEDEPMSITVLVSP